MEKKDFKVVNQRVDKQDSLGLACGHPAFADDLDFTGLLYGRLLWSPHAHARIKKIDASAALKVPGVKAVLTWKDVPRVLRTTAGQGYPEPSPYDTCTLDNKVRFVGDRVAAVAAETPEAAQEALGLIKVDYEVLPALFDPLQADKPGAPVIHDEPDAKNIPDARRNIAAKFEFEVKNGEWFKGADFVFEKTYSMPYLQHCAIENHTVITSLDSQNRLVIRTSTQVPFHVRRIVAQALQLPVRKIRVIKPRIGGGFGSKQEVLLEDICSALTLKTGRPVRIEYNRRETFVSSRTRHPAVVRLKTGVKKDGTITDAEMDITLNTGAYGSHALTVMMCSGSHTIPLYKVADNIRFIGKSVYTNLPVAGAYRGYGATQGFFAWESQMDLMADAVGMDRVEFRKRNYIRLGEGSPVFKAMGEGREGVEQVITSTGLYECIEEGMKAIKWKEKREKYRHQTGPLRRGLGMCGLMQGSGIPEVDMGCATIKMNEDGSFNLLMGAADLGTGSDTILSQIAAEVLGVKVSDIIAHSSDTDLTPFDVGAYASSTTFISGGAVKKAAERVREMIIEVGAKILEKRKEDLRLEGGRVVAKDGASCALSEVAHTSLYYSNQHQITASASHFAHTSPPPFAAHFAEVEVDTETGKVRILDYISCVDCGTAINPALAEGQNDGATLNGIGHTLSEEMEFSSAGTMLNAGFRRYKIPSTEDLPPLKTILIPTFEPNGPFGAKSVSEIGINGPLPAIANAIADAVPGARLYHAPFTPDKVLRAVKEAGGRGAAQ